jgi:hypothetical protein
MGATHRKLCQAGGLHPPYDDAVVAVRGIMGQHRWMVGATAAKTVPSTQSENRRLVDDG